MEKFTYIITIFWGTATVTLLAWLIFHINGIVLINSYSLLKNRIFHRQKIGLESENWSARASEPEILIIGIFPLAIASLISSCFGTCIHSLNATVVTELLIFSCLLAIYPRSNPKKYSWHYQILTDNWRMLLLGSIWCLSFAVWALIAINTPENRVLDPLLVNKNPDMWAYFRRLAALTTDNLSFDGNSACYYLINSPKKFSSFLGSLIVNFSNNSVFGITWFQGALGCSLFLCLFKEWIDFIFAEKSVLRWQKLLLIIWALSAPQIYWLVVSSYLSNTLFIIILCLGMRTARKMALEQTFNKSSGAIIFLSLLLIVFSFYPAFLPIAITLYWGTGIIYFQKLPIDLKTIFQQYHKLIITFIISFLGFYLLFKSQLLLDEVQQSFDVLSKHSTNFVPLNPWSLLQEKPKPMGEDKDFGVWINLIIGIIFSIVVSWKLWQKLNALKLSNYPNFLQQRNLIAALSGMAIYVSYLVLYIILEHSYRLGKIAISVIFPLAIFGLLPTLIWIGNQLKFQSKSRWLKLTIAVFAVVHILLHIDTTLSLGLHPSGRYIANLATDMNNINHIIVIGCDDVHVSQNYERMVGFQLAKSYPNISVNVIPDDHSKLLSKSSSDLLIYGQVIPGKSKKDNKNACGYDLTKVNWQSIKGNRQQ